MDMRVSAYGVIRDREHRVLLARWISGDRPSWTVPGGGLEPGEDPADAARREITEETGYTVELGELLGIHSRVIPAERRISASGSPLHTLRILYRAEITGGELTFEQNGSTDMAAWFTLDEVARLERVHLVDIALEMAGVTLP